jgi:hypothetical protein
MLNNSLSQILPSLVSFLIDRLIRLCVKNVSAAKVRPKDSSNLRPSHKLMYSEEFEKLSVERNL